MRLLFDQNLSNKLVALLADVFPDFIHVRDAGLTEASDSALWEYARANDFVIVSKDEDFHQFSFLHGPPPKVVWVRLGNCTTADIERTLRDCREELAEFSTDDKGAFLVVQDRQHTAK